MFRCLVPCIAIALIFSQGWCVNAQADDSAKRDFFERRIRPVLVKHCESCHSSDAKSIKGGLRVDNAQVLRSGGDSGDVLSLSDPSDSLLLSALNYDSLEMPPEGKLPAHVIKDFEKWIADGAFDPRTASESPGSAKITASERIAEGRQLWAFQRPKRHPLPTVRDNNWSQNWIDRFVQARHESESVLPAEDASRITLVRRLHFDLLGLPPSREAIEQFLADESPHAYSRMVDRLIASPAFGEHWGRMWLDVARYADSNGGDFNATFHNAWRYRDYVVNAMNNDKPFDQFVREQIAGDLLPFSSDEQRTEQIVATGFLMLGTKMLSERDKEKLTMDVVDEQINTVGSAFMGLTLGCCRCHDHKFDPIPTDDYYALAGIFRSTRTLQGESQEYVSTWPRRDLPAAQAHLAAVKKHASQKKSLEKDLTASKKQLEAAKKALESIASKSNALTFDDAGAEVAGSWKASTLTPRYIGKGYIHDNLTDKGEKSVEFKLKVDKAARYELQMSYPPGGNRANNIPLTIRHADGITDAVLDETKTPEINKLFTSINTFRFDADQDYSLVVSTTGTTGYVIVDAVRLIELDQNGSPVTATVNLEQVAALEKQTAETDKLTDQVASIEKAIKDLEGSAPPPLPKALAVDESTAIADCEVCIRGEHLNRGKTVERGFVRVALTNAIPNIDESTSGRHELADWISSPNHPLTARVIVNRVWYHLLGEGIVRSVDNFGELGERPTHPKLLDDLAVRFVTPASDGGLGWSIKQLVREIALTRTYQMSSEHNESAWQTDPENRLLWRAHRRRLPAESIRDSMLAISGRLDLSPGASPVEGLGTLVSNNQADAKKYSGKELPKRSIYLPIIRNELPSSLTVFDFADPDLVVGKRPVTNVPAQALLLMNSPFVMDSADATAERLLKRPDQTTQQLAQSTYKLILSRTPTDLELERAIAFLKDLSEYKKELKHKRLSQLIHVLFASTEFRMVN